MAGEPKNEAPFTNPVDTSGIGAAAQKSLTTPPPPSPGITAVRSSDELMNTATSDVDQDINSQVAPLQANLDTLGTAETNAANNITNMFGSILPYSQAAAGAVQGAYDNAEGAQANIMAAANARLNQLKQSRAQEAQAMAQEIGGPVAVGEFTAGLDDQASLLTNLGAGQQLHTLQYGLADTGVANAFAGRVLPLVQTEEQSKARSYFEDQKKAIQDQINSLKATRGSKITSEYNDLLSKERDYALQQTQQSLDKVKQQEDWQATLRTLKNDDKRLALTEKQFALQEAGTTGKYKGKPTLQAKQASIQDKRLAAQLGLSVDQYNLQKKQLEANTKLNQQKLAAAARATAAQYLDAAVNPQPGKTVTVTQAVPVPATAALKGTSGAYKDANSPTGYSKLVKVVQTPVTAPITNPTALVDYLVAHNVAKATAIRMVKARLQIPNWVYGEGDPNAPTGSGGRSGKNYTRPG